MGIPPRLHLASASPRRRQLLRALGLEFSVHAAETDERRLPGEPPAHMVCRLAAEKANAVAVDGDTVIIGADTAVVLGDRVLGKPRDRDDAVDMLRRLAGRSHLVMTGVAVRHGSALETVLSTTIVQFRDLSRDEASEYWQSGEPRDKAGAYGIQGLGGAFVESIDGSYSGVVGLPVFETAQLLKKVGIDVIAGSRL